MTDSALTLPQISKDPTPMHGRGGPGNSELGGEAGLMAVMGHPSRITAPATWVSHGSQ